MTRDAMIKHVGCGDMDAMGQCATCDAIRAALRSRPAPPDDLVALVRALITECHIVLSFAQKWEPLTPGDISGLRRAVDAVVPALAAPAPVAAPAPETPARKPFKMNVSLEWVMNMARHEAETLGAAPETPTPDAMPALGPDDVLSETSRFDGERCVSYTVSIERNGVVIWRRQEAQP